MCQLLTSMRADVSGASPQPYAHTISLNTRTPQSSSANCCPTFCPVKYRITPPTMAPGTVPAITPSGPIADPTWFQVAARSGVHLLDFQPFAECETRTNGVKRLGIRQSY